MAYRLWCAISGHGFGHLSQTAPLLNQLVKQKPAIEIHLVTALPHAVLARTFNFPFTVTNRRQDVGLVQPDPMQVDLLGTAAAIRSLHSNWNNLIEAEQQELLSWKPDLVLSNIAYLPIAAASALQIPTVAISSLTWDAVLAAYYSRKDPEIEQWWRLMRHAYGQATLALMPTPAIIEGTPFQQIEPIQPLTTLGKRQRSELRHHLGIAADDERPLILVSLGGIPAQHLPVEILAEESRYHWLVDVPIPTQQNHLYEINKLLKTWSFSSISASVDGVVSKPGYGMAIASAAQQIPFLYLRRGKFPDEPLICTWLEQVGRSMELQATEFYRGHWYQPLQTLMDRDTPPPPPVNGAEQGAKILIERFIR